MVLGRHDEHHHQRSALLGSSVPLMKRRLGGLKDETLGLT